MNLKFTTELLANGLVKILFAIAGVLAGIAFLTIALMIYLGH